MGRKNHVKKRRKQEYKCRFARLKKAWLLESTMQGYCSVSPSDRKCYYFKVVTPQHSACFPSISYHSYGNPSCRKRIRQRYEPYV